MDYFTKDGEFSAALVSAVINKPDKLIVQPWHWGKLLSVAGDKSRQLRDAYLTSFLNFQEIGSERGFGPFHLYKFELPHEISILAPFASGAISVLWETEKHSFRNNRENRQIEIFNEILSCIPPVDTLVSSMENFDLPKITRAGCLILWLLSQTEVISQELYIQELNRIRPLIDDLYNDIYAYWFIGGIAWVIGKKLSESNEISRELIGRLFILSKNSYKGRMVLESLLAKWREVSGTPVRSRQLQEKWLADNA